jgi:murein endopeptidase
MKQSPELHAVTALRAAAAALWLGFLACSGAVEPPKTQAALSPTGRVPASASASAVPTARAPESDDGQPDGDDDLTPHDDGLEDDESAPFGELRAHPLDGWTPERIEQALGSDPASLGAISVGSPNAGLLLNGVQAQDSTLYTVVSPSAAWATSETLESLGRAIRAVHAEFPGTQPLMLGDISAKGGGPLRPHVSHQSGRDVDIGYYYTTGAAWYVRGTQKNLDLARTWGFVRALIAETDIDLILIDHSIQKLLIEHALGIGEDRDWLESVFKGGAGQRPIIRHARGHATHIHVRFFNPIAQETARRAYDALVRRKLVPPQNAYVQHRVKNGETLGMIAKKYGTTVRAIQNANRLKGTRIRAKAVYAIPVRSAPKPRTEPVRVPPRRVPPIRRKLASSER